MLRENYDTWSAWMRHHCRAYLFLVLRPQAPMLFSLFSLTPAISEELVLVKKKNRSFHQLFTHIN